MAYTGVSIVDYLKSIGQASDFTTRKKLAQQYGITNYTGTASQNTQLLNMMRSGQKPAEPAAPPVAPAAPAAKSTGTDWTAYYQGVLANPTATEAAKAEARQKLGITEPGEKKEEKKEEKKAPDWLEDNEYFQQLPPDEQEYMVQYYNVLSIQDEENQKILAKALEDAKAQADPYFAEKIRMAQDELTRALGKQAGDFGSQKRDIELRIDQIKEDLATGKGRLSVDEQAELARQQRKYEYQLEDLIEGAASRGLTFSTKRALAESRLATEQTDIVESTKREFQRRITDLQMAASRGEVAAQNLLADYERMYGENVTTLIRGAEKQLGTENLPSGLPSLPGVSPLGGVVGSFEEEKQMDILQRAEALANLNNPFL